MTETNRKILVTSALPYANGSIHLGHMVEYVQTDIWVRFQKAKGNNCIYVCADDSHGTPIMLRAQDEGISPEELINRISIEHQLDFKDFSISFDNYHSTHSPENKELSSLIYKSLKKSGHINKRTIKQLYDTEKQIFLPDRFIKGTCPKCNANDQYGDNCESCGSTYSPTELKNPKSVISGASPVEKETEHLFFELSNFENFLKTWTKSSENLQSQVSNKLQEWFKTGLKAWDISRDAPYFGFEIPEESGKYFYVWLDAPVGYMASFKSYCDKNNLSFDEYWKEDSTTELYHFIGKDIVYFHSLFWPAMLHGAEFRVPTSIFAHGFLTVDGQKMSKSRGTFITARTYLNHLNQDYLRYYFAGKLNSGIDDLNLNLDDFIQRVNSDLVGKIINIASRSAGFIHKKFDGKLASQFSSQGLELYQKAIDSEKSISNLYEKREYAHAMREIMSIADKVNEYIDYNAPWVMAKNPDKQLELHDVVTVSINLFRVLITYVAPVIPTTATKAKEFLNIDNLQWHEIQKPLLMHSINKFNPLMTRVEQDKVNKMLDDSKHNLKK